MAVPYLQAYAAGKGSSMKRIFSFMVVLILVFGCFTTDVKAEDAKGITVYGDSVNKNSFYERVVKLSNGDLLATWMREFPINSNWSGMKTPQFYRSSDEGKTWNLVSEITPENDGISRDKLGMQGLFVFPKALGNYPAGTILFATSDWNTADEYTIHIWRSTDNGNTWKFHSQLAPRDNRSTWEPEFAVSGDGKLVCYYSDERQKGYDQCVAYEVSNDGGVTWGGYTIVAGEYEEGWVPGVSEGNWRPGMPRVLKLKNGSYLMAYENINAQPYGAITVRHSPDGLSWGGKQELGTVVTNGQYTAYQCPEIALVDDGTENGRLFLRGMNDSCSPSQCFTSTDNGYTWSVIDAPLTAVRNERTGSSWSGTFLTLGNKLLEINNYYNGTYNEIRCGSGILYGNQLIVSGADYKVVNSASGLCMDNPAGSLEPGTQMILWSDNNLKTQSWHFEDTASGVYKIKGNYSGLILDNKEGSNQAGAVVRQWEDNGAPAERWLLERADNGLFRIKNQYGGLYMDTENQSSGPHTALVQMPLSNSSTQKWRLERIYETARFESMNIKGNYIRHANNGDIIIDSEFTSLPLKDSQWRVIPGLADGTCISLESVNKPGYYLRHRNGKLELSLADGTDLMKADATWRVRNGLADSGMVSLESYNIAGNYIRHYNGVLYIAAITTDLDKKDATFIMMKQ